MRQIFILLFFISTNFVSIAQKIPQQFTQAIANGKLKMDKSYFFYKDIKSNELKEETISVKNFSKDDIELVFRSVPNYISLELNPLVIKPNELAEIKFVYDATKRIDKKGGPILGREYRRIPIYIKGQEKSRDSRRDYITVRTFVQEDFSQLSKKQLKRAPIIKFDTIVYNFGEVVQGTILTHEFKFTNLGKDNLDIRYAKGC